MREVSFCPVFYHTLPSHVISAWLYLPRSSLPAQPVTQAHRRSLNLDVDHKCEGESNQKFPYVDEDTGYAMIQPHQAGSYSILEGIENRLMPEVQAVGDQAYPAERSPLEEAFDRTCIKENDHDATAIGHREAKLIGPTEDNQHPDSLLFLTLSTLA